MGQDSKMSNVEVLAVNSITANRNETDMNTTVAMMECSLATNVCVAIATHGD